MYPVFEADIGIEVELLGLVGDFLDAFGRVLSAAAGGVAHAVWSRPW